MKAKRKSNLPQRSVVPIAAVGMTRKQLIDAGICVVCKKEKSKPPSAMGQACIHDFDGIDAKYGRSSV